MIHNIRNETIKGIARKSGSIRLIQKSNNLSLEVSVFLILLFGFIHFSMWLYSSNTVWITAYLSLVAVFSILLSVVGNLRPTLNSELENSKLGIVAGNSWGYDNNLMSKHEAIRLTEIEVSHIARKYKTQLTSYALSAICLIISSYIPLLQ